MRFIIVGAGGVGGVVGGRLFEHGHDVALVARGPHLEAIRGRGLTVDWPDGVRTLAIPVVGHVSELTPDPDDIVVVATKSHDAVGIFEDVRSVRPDPVPIVTLQNGVDNERSALRYFPDVYAVLVVAGAVHLRPGMVQALSAPVSGILDVGRYPSGVDDRVREIVAAFASATFSSEAVADIMRWKYYKLLGNLSNAIDALCGFEARDGRLGDLVRAEGEAVLAAAGIEVPSEREASDRWAVLTPASDVDRRGVVGSSSWQSLARGTGSIESDFLNGEIVLLGRTHGIPTPVNELLQRLATRAARGYVPPGTVSAEAILAELGGKVVFPRSP